MQKNNRFTLNYDIRTPISASWHQWLLHTNSTTTNWDLTMCDHNADNHSSRRKFLKTSATALTGAAAVAATGITANANADVSVYAAPAKPVLPAFTMTLDLRRTVIAIIDPQIDFLSPEGVTWGVVG
jgi:hypothetical protein